MWKKPVFSVMSFVLLLALAELTARQVEKSVTRQVDEIASTGGWQDRFFASIFDWHEPDPELLWRLKPNLQNQYIRTNSSHTIGPEIPATKFPGVYRVLLLGDSSPLGLGLTSYEHSFGSRLHELLRTSYGSDRVVELVNASVAGYSSEQLRRYLELHGAELEPDLIIIYCGNNDASISGHFTDRELIASQNMSWLRQKLSRTALYRLLRSAIHSRDQMPLSGEQPFVVRVSPERFGENLNEIASTCHILHCRLIVVKPPVPLCWPAALQFKWLSSMNDSLGRLVFPRALIEALNQPIRYCLERDRFPARYGEPDKITQSVLESAHLDTMAPRAAVEYYSRQLRTEPNSHIMLNNLGVAYWELGEFDSADIYMRAARGSHVDRTSGLHTVVGRSFGSIFLFNIGINWLSRAQAMGGGSPMDTLLAFTYLDSALQADYLSLRVKRTYLDKVNSLVANDSNVAMVDLSTIFAINGGESLFVDHCHPTALGHRLIADALFETIVNR